MSKSCLRCEESLPLTEFHRNRKAKDGRYGYCKPCSKAKTYAWNAANPERWRKQRVKTRLKTRYGLSPDEWGRLLIQQAGRCAVCTTELRYPNVDHCHTTGRVRGLLCRSCNQGLGMFKDEAGLLAAAIEYLS